MLWIRNGAVVITLALSVSPLSGQVTNGLINPQADAFVRANAPTNNYGGAGALSVSGAQAINGFGVAGGRADALVRFQFSRFSPMLDNWFGNHDWLIVASSLQLYEIAAPNNSLFSRGTGSFEISWLSSTNNWLEGSGSPIAPTTNGVTFQDLHSLVDPAHDISLGIYTNRGTDGSIALSLPLPATLSETIKAGGPVTFHFQPASESVGFTFLSRSDSRVNFRLALELIAAPGPAPRISSINLSSNQVSIQFSSRSDLTEILEWNNGLEPEVAPAWKALFTAPSGRSEIIPVLDSITNAHRFYRLRVVP